MKIPSGEKEFFVFEYIRLNNDYVCLVNTKFHNEFHIKFGGVRYETSKAVKSAQQILSKLHKQGFLRRSVVELNQNADLYGKVKWVYVYFINWSYVIN